MGKQETGTTGETFAAQDSYSAAGCSVVEIRRRSGIEHHQMQRGWPAGKDCRAAIEKEVRE